MAVTTRIESNMADLRGRDQWTAIMAALHPKIASKEASRTGVAKPHFGFWRSEHPFTADALLLFLAIPDHAGKALQRHQRLAGIGPFLHLLDGDMIARLPAGTAREQRARDVYHMRRTRALIKQRRAASPAKAARGFG